jgi:hypothetical protein
MNFIVKPLIRKRSASFAGHFLTPQQISLKQSRAKKRAMQGRVIGDSFHLKTFFSSHPTAIHSIEFLKQNIFDVSFIKQSIFLFSSFARSFKKTVSFVSHHSSGGGFSYSKSSTLPATLTHTKNGSGRTILRKSPFGILFGWSDTRLISNLLGDKNKFNAFVYTPWRDAVSELNARAKDTGLETYLQGVLPSSTPEVLRTGKNMVLARQLATPNYEMYRFMQIADVTSLNPIVLEYKHDRYVNVSQVKYALAELNFHKGFDQATRKARLLKLSIINRNESNGKRIDTLTTKWGQHLTDFHNEFFINTFPSMANQTYDLSDMYHELGGGAAKYYNGFLSLFLKHSILFENFLFSSEELRFMEKIFLPALITIKRESKYTPLIVELVPERSEDDIFWLSYPPTKFDFVDTYTQCKQHVSDIISE